MPTEHKPEKKRMMKSLFIQGIIPLVACALMLPMAVSAQTQAYTSTGWVIGELVPGIVCTNSLGQVLFRAEVHRVRVLSSDARVTGNRLIIVHGAYNADGSANIQGNCYEEVGTWDAAGTNLKATGGMWELSYQGIMGADNSLLLNLVGYGSGGAIEGMRLEETLTRAPSASSQDTTVPFLYTGTLKPAPVNIRTVVDNFNDGRSAGWTGYTNTTLIETNQQFTVIAKMPWVTREHWDTWAFPYKYQNWSVANGQNLECRVDLVGMSENATNAAGIVLWSDSDSKSYILFKGRDFVQVGKWVGPGVAVFLHEKVVIKNTNVVLSLSLTRVNPNMVVTARVLDKDNQEAVLYERSVVDTPKVDRTVTSAEILALSGMKLNVYPDSGPPIISGDSIFLNAFQYTDGKQPDITVTYDNLELWTYEIPHIAVEPAVRLMWPAAATAKYGLLGAPTVTGPWLPVQELNLPGFQQMTVPASQASQFFRLQQTP